MSETGKSDSDTILESLNCLFETTFSESNKSLTNLSDLDNKTRMDSKNILESSDLKNLNQIQNWHNFPSTSGAASQKLKAAEPRYTKEDVLSKYPRLITEEEVVEINLVSEVYYFAEKVKRPKSYRREDNHYTVIPNDHLKFRYRILDTLNSGCFSTVIKAFDMKYSREVAVKIIKNNKSCLDYAIREDFIFKFLEERKSSGYDFIVSFYESFLFRSHFCLVFEVLGEDLSDVISTSKLGLTSRKIRNLVKCVLSGLSFLHRNDLIHSDLKPNNIALIPGSYFECKIIDLGLALRTTETSARGLVQAVQYRAPEVFLGGPYDVSIDIFSLGLIMIELAVQQKPFYHRNPVRHMYNYIETLGMPPESLLQSSSNATDYFDEDTEGHYCLRSYSGGKVCRPKSLKLEERIFFYHDQEFLNFVKNCLAINPMERPKASQLLEHQWMKQSTSK